MDKMNEPLNAQERYLYGINVRLEVLINQMSSLIEHISKQDSVSIQENRITEAKEEIKEEAPVVKQTRKRKPKVTE